MLGYSKWERFEGVIERAKDACINAGEMVEYHFPGVGKMIPLAKGAQREVKELHADSLCLLPYCTKW